MDEPPIDGVIENKNKPSCFVFDGHIHLKANPTLVVGVKWNGWLYKGGCARQKTSSADYKLQP